MDPEKIKNKTIILFDGNCGLCSRSVKFVLLKEKTKNLYFCALQSAAGQSFLKQFDLQGRGETMVLIKNNKAHVRSGAALRVAPYLKGLWPLAVSLLVVPAFIRNFIYDYMAKRRITWFGSADYCEMITPELKKRFLE